MVTELMNNGDHDAIGSCQVSHRWLQTHIEFHVRRDKALE